MKRSYGYYNYGAPVYMGAQEQQQQPQQRQAQYHQQQYQQPQQLQPYFYPGPPQALMQQQQHPLQQGVRGNNYACHYAPFDQAFAIPTFEQLIKNRILNERRFYLSNSNSKWLSLGVTPATKILDEGAKGFQTEIFLCGEKGNISLGGVAGAAALFKAFRAMPQFAPMYTSQKFDFKGCAAENIVVTKANFGNEVYKIVNTHMPEKSGWLAATSVQMLLAIEALFMTAATSFDAPSIEEKFNSLIDKGTRSVTDMEACVLSDGNLFELDLMANFKDFVYLCVDIKKKNDAAAEQQPLQQQQQQQALTPPTVQFSPQAAQMQQQQQQAVVQQPTSPLQQQQQQQPMLLPMLQQQQQQQPQVQEPPQQAAEKNAKRARK